MTTIICLDVLKITLCYENRIWNGIIIVIFASLSFTVTKTNGSKRQLKDIRSQPKEYAHNDWNLFHVSYCLGNIIYPISKTHTMFRKYYGKPDEPQQTALGEPLPDTPATPPPLSEILTPLADVNRHERRPMSVQPGRVARSNVSRPQSDIPLTATSPPPPIRHRPMTVDPGHRLRSDSANTLVEEGDIANETTKESKNRPHHQLRRYKTKRIPLVKGNLVLDCPIPEKLLDAVPRRNSEEFTHMRYTAATCDPDDFQTSGYTLRPRIYGRQTELFIVVTMYNVSH